MNEIWQAIVGVFAALLGLLAVGFGGFQIGKHQERLHGEKEDAEKELKLSLERNKTDDKIDSINRESDPDKRQLDAYRLLKNQLESRRNLRRRRSDRTPEQ